MDIRELTDAEFVDLLELCRRTLPLDPFTLPALRTHIRGEPQHNPAYQLGLWDGEQLVGAMLGGVRSSGEGPIAALRLFAVEPAYRRRGLAGHLLVELEERFRAAGLNRLLVGGSAPDYFWPGLDIRYTPAFCFLQRHGFERFDDAVNMDVDLHARDWNTTADEARLAAAGFAIRRLRPEDRDEFSAWLQETWNPAWHWEGLASYANDPVSTFVATQDGRICAFACYGVTTFPHGFGPTGTEPALQGRGLGRVLFFRCMADLRDQGHRTAEVCWTGPIAFYARVADAVMSRVFWFLGKDLVAIRNRSA